MEPDAELSLLLIDDKADPLFGVGSRSQSVKHHIALAENDSAALALMQSERAFDAALVNIDSPALSGLDIFRRLSGGTLRIPRIALTDGRDLARLRAAIADGAADVVMKPVAGVELDQTLVRVLRDVERRRAQWRDSAEHAALRREIDLAADMQRRVLPASMALSDGLEIAAMMRPARGVGGDFYDAFEIDADRIGVVVADVSGKGVPAAFYMAMASTALRTTAMRGGNPAQCIRNVNQYLVAREIPAMFVSMFYLEINCQEWTFRSVNAGHPEPLLLRGGEAMANRLASDGGPVLGVLPDYGYVHSHHRLAPQDVLVLFSDGVTEARDIQRKEFGAARLEALANAERADAAALIEHLNVELDSFTQSAEQHDDITLLALRRKA